MEGLLIN